jgi:sugar phosphate isomerase/epimerase
LPSFGISQITTVNEPFDTDVHAYAEAGVDGIGVWEMKLPDGDDSGARARLRDAGLSVTSCVPTVPSILPLVRMEGPDDPDERVASYCASIRRLAPFEPTSFVLLTGSAAGRDSAEARGTVVEGLRTITAEAERVGVSVGLEPLQRVGGDDWTIISSIPEAVELLAEAGTPRVGLVVDIGHVWNTTTLFDDLAQFGDRITAVHVCDCREAGGVWSDRVLPGDGAIDVPRILGALEDSGWDGPYDLEIFSDDLWQEPGGELASRGRAAFVEAWRRRA